MNVAAQQRDGKARERDGATLRFAVNAPLSKAELWGIARRQMLTWQFLIALIFLGWFTGVYAITGERYLDRASLGMLTFGAICVGLTPANAGWNSSKLRTLSLSTKEIRSILVMAVLPLLIVLQVSTWLAAAACIGVEHFNFWYFTLLVTLIHIGTVVQIYRTTTPERSEIDSEKHADDSEDSAETADSTLADLKYEFIKKPVTKAVNILALAVGLPLAVILAAWLIAGVWGPSVLAGAGAIYVAVTVVSFGTSLERSFTNWLAFGAPRAEWFSAVAKNLILWATVFVMIGYLITTACLYVGNKMGRELKFNLAVSLTDYALLWAAAAIAMVGTFILVFSLALPLNNREDGWGNFFAHVGLLVFIELTATAVNGWTIKMLANKPIWNETPFIVAITLVLLGLLLAGTGLSFLKWASKRMDIAYVNQPSVFGFTAK